MKNPLLQKIADNWMLDARLEDSAKYFYNFSEVKSILDNHKCYVIGRKGTGKTAICQHIITTKQYDAFSTKLSFKNFPFNELYSLQNNKYTMPNQYITLWKYLIYSTVCKMMVTNEAVEPSVRTELSKLYPEKDARQLARKVSEWTSVKFGATVLGTGGSIGLSRENTVTEFSWIEKCDMLEDIIVQYATESKYYIVFDELDEDYREINDNQTSDSYIYLLTSLFKAVQDVKATFAETCVMIMPIVFLRDDIYMLIKDSDKNKWSDLKIELEWTESKLKDMLAYRISREISEKEPPLGFKKAWEKIFSNKEISYGTNQGKRTDSFDFISRDTHLRPRDFIRYIQNCSEEAARRDNPLVFGSTIKYVDRSFSNYLRAEIEDEVYPLLPDINNIFQILSNMRKQIFDAKEFINEYNKYLKAGTISEKNVDKVLDVLYNFSVIGNQNKFQDHKQYFKYLHTNMTYNKEEKIVIHRGLLKSLQII